MRKACLATYRFNSTTVEGTVLVVSASSLKDFRLRNGEPVDIKTFSHIDVYSHCSGKYDVWSGDSVYSYEIKDSAYST